MSGRYDEFTRRCVSKREKLFNPEVSDWPVEDDHGANWDFVWTILGAFGLVVGVVVVGLLAWVVGII